jgi:hypothetical protein
MDRRRFLKVASLWLVAAGGALWAGAVLRGRADRRTGRRAARVAGPGPGSWGPLIHLVDAEGRDAYAVHGVLLDSGQLAMVGGAAARYIEFMLDPAVSTPAVVVRRMDRPMDRPEDYLLCAGNAPLADGRVLFAGGSGPDETGLGYAMLLDPASGTWSRIMPDMAGGVRWYPTVTRLPDARLVITGGFYDFGGAPNRSVEIFDPAAQDAGRNPWTQLISHHRNPWVIEPTGEDYTHVFVLPRPIVVKGYQRQLVMVGKTGQLHFVNYTATFSRDALRFCVRPHSRRPGPGRLLLGSAAASVLLPDGRIMMVGGTSDPVLAQSVEHIHGKEKSGRISLGR